jgi:CheY-like chemotaxis protein
VDGSTGLVALVVDDEEPVLDEVRECVRRDGRCTTILTASDAAGAIRILTGDHRVDIAFLDIRMTGLDGVELARLISIMAEPPRIVFVTAYAAHLGDAFDLHVADYVLKPMHESRISAAITRAIRQRDADLPRGRSLPELGSDGAVRQVVEQPETHDAKRAFLSYSRSDATQAHELFTRLVGDWVSCWYDQDVLLPGQDWQREVRLAIQRSRFFLACLSDGSVHGAGYRHSELRYALEVATTKPEDQVFLVPVRLEPCRVPDALAHLHAVDLFRADGYDRLLAVLREGGAAAPLSR